MKKFAKKYLLEFMVIALVLGIVSSVFAAQLGNPSVVGGTNRSVDRTQIRPEGTNALASLDNATGANTAVDLGASSKDLFCVGYLSNSAGTITGLAAADSATITVQGSVEGVSGPGWYTLGSFSLANSIISTITNTTLPARYIRANISAIGNSASYANVKCLSRSDW